VNRMANARREHFGFPIVVVVDFDDVGEQLKAVKQNLNNSSGLTPSA
jgi:2-oxo-4-hydroxy-4-carboxy--5-ureidoimidazoline (OHCU) decarboxylase